MPLGRQSGHEPNVACMPFSRPSGAHLMGNSQLYQLYQLYDRFSLGVPNGIVKSTLLLFVSFG
eukprot:COSAG01_NODE_7893_length_3002_cov_5.993802_2_plen_63_part_00